MHEVIIHYPGMRLPGIKPGTFGLADKCSTTELTLLLYVTCCSSIYIFQSYDDDDTYPGSQGMNVGSFPKDFGYGPDEYDTEGQGAATAETKPRILLIGLRR